MPDGGEPVRLRGGDADTVADDPDRELQVVVLPGRRRVTPEGRAAFRGRAW